METDQILTASDDTVTDSNTRTLSETQQPRGLQITGDDNGNPLPATSLGVGAADDDNSNDANTVSGTNASLNAAANAPFAPQPNVLDQYASYTYSLSWYLLSPDQFNNVGGQLQFSDTGQNGLNTSGWTLIMQSGGASSKVASTTSGGRSPYFTQDYYMDNLIIETGLASSTGGGTNAANMGGNIEFTVTEPNGITLINNLAGAVQDVYSKAGVESTGERPNYPGAFYCMVIKFYGYDQAGNLVQAGKSTSQQGQSNVSSPVAAVTKIYPFVIKQIGFRLSNRIIEYKVEGSAVQYFVNASSRRGTIPAQFELVGATVGDILSGNASGGTSIAIPPDGRTPTAAVKSSPKTASSTERITSVAEIQYDQLGNPI